ncbi:MAG TPA: thiol-disulfide oxidoreductase DCC family protein [Polyangia bacterium]|jgi:predicted DCC family thiol-disulfide oxidoreductase YuxK|nr:thiol-disulfide oxidoreductase DCC family protein [Polyangia bacterium]
MEPTASPIVLFDGVCNLCNAAVNFILDHERSGALRFASLQSDAARALLAEHGAPVEQLRQGDPDTMMLLEGGRVFDRSAAALRVARHLRWPWRALGVFLLVPRPLRDLVYRWVARNRYRWFGKSDACRMPSPALRARFLG